MADIHMGFQNPDRSAAAEDLFKFLDEANALESVRDYRRRMLELYAPKPSDRVLDIGCGIGHATLELAAKVGTPGSVTGIDKSEALIAEARRRAAGVTPPLDYRVGDACRLDFPDHHFDLCRIERVLMYLEEPERALDELVRVLRPGGRFALFEFDYDHIVVDARDETRTQRILGLVGGSIPSPSVGRRVGRLLRGRGGRELTVTPHMILTPLAMFRRVIGGTLDAAIVRGEIEADDVDRWWHGLDKANRSDEFFAGFLGFIVCGELGPGRFATGTG